MATQATGLTTGRVDHLKLTVTDVGRSRDFYTGLLGFDVVAEFGPSTLVSNGEVLMGLSPAPDPARATTGDQFDENRVGLDHLSFSVTSRTELERAIRLLDERGGTTWEDYRPYRIRHLGADVPRPRQHPTRVDGASRIGVSRRDDRGTLNGRGRQPTAAPSASQTAIEMEGAAASLPPPAGVSQVMESTQKDNRGQDLHADGGRGGS